MRVIKILGVSIGVILLIIAGLMYYVSLEKIDTFYLKGAEMLDPAFLIQAEEKKGTDQELVDIINATPTVAAHRIEKGKGTIFAYRKFSLGNILTIDDETFEKVTIWIFGDYLRAENTLNLSDNKRVIAVYSKGGSVWPESTCSGYIKNGFLKVHKQNSQYHIILEGTLEPKGVRHPERNCQIQTMKYDLYAEGLEFKDLTPWLGTKGEHHLD